MQEHINDVGIFNSKGWVAKQANQGQLPVDGSSSWETMLSALPAKQIPVQDTQPTDQVTGDQWYQVI